MYSFNRYILLFTTFLSLFNQLAGQSALNEILVQKLEHQKQLHPVSLFFIHTDKTIYTNNESVLWAGYLINDTLNNIPQADIISVMLIDETSREIFCEKKHRLTHGLASGSLILPDSIPPGDYQLIAYPNLFNANKEPVSIFRQPITIKSTKNLLFNTVFKFEDSSLNNDTLKIDVSVLQGGSKLTSKATLEYQLFDNKIRRLQTDNLGKAVLFVPRKAVNVLSPTLRTTTILNGEKFLFNLKLPSQKHNNQFSIKFYPEGGDLVEGIMSQIGWESLNGDLIPTPVQAVLYRNLTPIDTIQTDNYGMGVFNLTPESGVNYSVKCINTIQDTISYPLPAPLSEGWVIKATKGVLDSTLQLHIATNKKDSFSIAIFNSFTGFVSNKMKIEKERLLTLKMNQMPKGILTITLLNGLNQPVAERPIFSHYNLRNSIDIKTDREVYRKRDSIRLDIQVKNPSGNRIEAVVSVACVQNNRIEKHKQNNIEWWTFLHREPGYQLLYHSGQAKNSDYLEKALLVRGWRKYDWQKVMNDECNSLSTFYKTNISGKVMRFGKPLKKAESLILLAWPDIFTVLNTDSIGDFDIPIDNITLEEGKKIYLSVNSKSKAGYTYNVEDPFFTINRKLSKDSISTPFVRKPGYNINTKTLLLEDFSKYSTLEEVVVRSIKDNSLFSNNANYGSNACGDYVCVNGILNCPRHGTGIAPIKGKQYVIDGVGIRIYQGCSIAEDEKEYFQQLEGVYFGKTYYGMDSLMLRSTTEEFASTILWIPQLHVRQNIISKHFFYTSDLTGKFRIVVQGVTENGEPLFAEKTIEIAE
jgi:hypothetical protein